MRVLVACERSGVVREAFRKRGHHALSCDIVPSDDNSKYHIQDDVRNVLKAKWHLMIAFPPCDHLCVSGARWFKDKQKEQQEALDFIARLMMAPIEKIAIENPVGVISTWIKKPNQIIQPWEFGHGETKTTCLWLKNLPHLIPTNIVSGRQHLIHEMPPSDDRGIKRSKTYQGIAEAMAEQWGCLD